MQVIVTNRGLYICQIYFSLHGLHINIQLQKEIHEHFQAEHYLHKIKVSNDHGQYLYIYNQQLTVL